MSKLPLIVRGTTGNCSSSFVDEYLVRLLTGIAHERNLTQLVLHHPLEITVQMAVDEENVERSLMVGHKHIALGFLQMFATLYLDRNQKKLQNQFTPPMSWEVTPEVAIADGSADAHLQRRYYRQDYQQWQPNHQLINLI